MSNVQQAIRDAAERGGYRYRWWKVDDLEHNEGYNGLQLRALSEHLEDPDFWKALSTARKWEDTNAWRFHWHRFIDHLADGKMRRAFSPSYEVVLGMTRCWVHSVGQVPAGGLAPLGRGANRLRTEAEA
jgi:hypothetical protein